MGMVKHYINNIVCRCGDGNQFAEDAIEYSILMGHLKLTLNMDDDVRLIMSQYDDIIERYHQVLNNNLLALWSSYEPILQQLNAPPLHASQT